MPPTAPPGVVVIICQSGLAAGHVEEARRASNATKEPAPCTDSY